MLRTSKPTNFYLPYKMNLLKSIPNVPCACCGRQTLQPDKIEAAYKSLEKPLKSVLKNLLPMHKDKKNIVRILERLANTFPNLSFNKITENPDSKKIIYDGIKQFCGQLAHSKSEREELSKKLFFDIKEQSTQDLRSASTVMKRLQSFKKYLSYDYLQIFEQLEIYAQKYPRKSISEILESDEVYNFHKTKNKLYQQQTNDKYNFHIKNISKIVKQPSEIITAQLKEIVRNNTSFYSYDPKTQKGKLKDLYKEILVRKYNLDNRQIEKVLSEIDKLPIGGSFVDKFFIQMHGSSDHTIINKLISPHFRSFEHIIPQVNNGSNNISNGIILCYSCNSARQAIPYREYLQYHPEMITNTQKQIDYVTKLILSGKLEADLMDWPIKVAKTLTNYTNGMINVDISKYNKKLLKKSNNQISELEKEKNEINTQIEELMQKLEILNIKSKQNNTDIKFYNRILNLINPTNK